MSYLSSLMVSNGPLSSEAFTQQPPASHASAVAAHAVGGIRGERDALLHAMDKIPDQARLPREAPDRPWTPMIPLFNQDHWNQVTTVLMRYVDNGKPDEYRAEACRRIEKAMTDPAGRDKLDLSNLGLREAPPLLPNVVELNLSGNRLTELPPLPCTVKKLFLARNRLKKLPAVLPPALTLLHVAYNDLSELPDTLPNTLTSLHAQGNALRELPANMPRSLHTIDVCGNRGPNLVSAAAGTLIQLQLERKLMLPVRALIDRGHALRAERRCNNAMSLHLRELLPNAKAHKPAAHR